MKKVPINCLYGDIFFYNRKKYQIDAIHKNVYTCYEVADPNNEIRLPCDALVGVENSELRVLTAYLSNDIRRSIVKIRRLKEALNYLRWGYKSIPQTKKQPWQMTRIEWVKARRPVCNIHWKPTRVSQKVTFRIGKKWEYRAICEFMNLLPKTILDTPDWEGGCMGPTTYLPDRCKSFAIKEWTSQTYSSLIFSFEDAREAILLGRLLGYKEQDIAFYLVRNYIIPNINSYNMKESL